MAKVYQIGYTQPTVYLERGLPTNGFVVRGIMLEFDEPFEITVPKMDDKDIDAKIMNLIAQRKKLEQLGNDKG